MLTAGVCTANDSAVVTVSGTIPVSCSVKFDKTSLEITDFNSLVIYESHLPSVSAPFSVSCNTLPKYTIEADNGYLKHESNEEEDLGSFTNKIYYSVDMSVNGEAIFTDKVFSETTRTITDESSNNIPYNSDSGLLTVETISTGGKSLIAGNYSDVLTITISGHDSNE